jgi:hypothetical protein
MLNRSTVQNICCRPGLQILSSRMRMNSSCSDNARLLIDRYPIWISANIQHTVGLVYILTGGIRFLFFSICLQYLHYLALICNVVAIRSVVRSLLTSDRRERKHIFHWMTRYIVSVTTHVLKSKSLWRWCIAKQTSWSLSTTLILI